MFFFPPYIYIDCGAAEQVEVRIADRTNESSTRWLDDLRRTPSKEDAAARLESNRARGKESAGQGGSSKAGTQSEDKPSPQSRSHSQPASSTSRITEFSTMSMPMPEGFARGKVTNGAFSQSEYNLKADADVRLQFFYRGQRMTDPAAKAFSLLLNKSAGENVSDLQKAPLNELLMDKGNATRFKITAAKIDELDGKKALMVEGVYLQEPMQSRTYFAAPEDARLTGSVVQEIQYLAPKAKYEKYRPRVLRSIKAIDWQ